MDSLLVMGEDGGFDEAVNRGPRALVDFLYHFQEAFGINIREFLTAGSNTESQEREGVSR